LSHGSPGWYPFEGKRITHGSKDQE